MNIFSNTSVNYLLVIACFYSITVYADTSKLTTKMEKKEPKISTEKKKWLGKTFKQAETELGAPSSQETFYMKDAVITEFRGKLELLFPKSSHEYDLIRIKEVSWKLNDYFLTLWFVNKNNSDWVVADSFLWRKDSEF